MLAHPMPPQGERVRTGTSRQFPARSRRCHVHRRLVALTMRSVGLINNPRRKRKLVRQSGSRHGGAAAEPQEIGPTSRDPGH